MFVVLFYDKLHGFLGKGPSWFLAQNNSQCDKYWWTSLLYINNFYPKKTNNGYKSVRHSAMSRNISFVPRNINCHKAVFDRQIVQSVSQSVSQSESQLETSVIQSFSGQLIRQNADSASQRVSKPKNTIWCLR